MRRCRVDILGIAEENHLASLGVVLAVGIIQGAILGRGIRARFPRLKAHARAVSLVLLVLLAANAIAGVARFAVPDKISLFDMAVPASAGEGISLVLGILGLNTGLGATIIVFVSITLVLVFRFARLPRAARYFVFGISVVMAAVFLLARFTDYVPTGFQVMLYASYQAGITIGVFVVTRRGVKE